jgi:hypothetical protein
VNGRLVPQSLLVSPTCRESADENH